MHMPTNSREILEYFTKIGQDPDAIKNAEEIIKKHGGIFLRSQLITIPDPKPESEEFWKALEFLLDEWDYKLS